MDRTAIFRYGLIWALWKLVSSFAISVCRWVTVLGPKAS